MTPRWTIEGRDWPNRDASRFVDSGGLRWQVQVAGAGPVLLLLHGTGAATHSWRDLLPLLAHDFTVIAPDLPGHGFTSGRPVGGLSMPAMARAVAALLHALDMRPTAIVGHSAGAAIAIRMALDGLIHPQGIVGLNAALLPFPGLAAKLFPALARALFVNPFAPHIMARIARTPGEVARFLPRSTGSRIDARGTELYARLLGNSSHVAGAITMMAGWNLDALRRDLPTLAVPLFLIHGDADSAIAPRYATEAAALVRNGRTIVLPGLGHLAHEEQPADIAAIIRKEAA